MIIMWEIVSAGIKDLMFDCTINEMYQSFTLTKYVYKRDK